MVTCIVEENAYNLFEYDTKHLLHSWKGEAQR
jgi:hypothetical protein